MSSVPRQTTHLIPEWYLPILVFVAARSKQQAFRRGIVTIILYLVSLTELTQNFFQIEICNALLSTYSTTSTTAPIELHQNTGLPGVKIDLLLWYGSRLQMSTYQILLPEFGLILRIDRGREMFVLSIPSLVLQHTVGLWRCPFSLELSLLWWTFI